MNQWRNWAGNQVCAPTTVEHPASVDELAQIVKSAAATGSTVKVVGAGHSFTDIACTNGTQVVLDRYASVVSADVGPGLVTVQAGITLGALNEALDSLGLALANLGDIAYQTVSGALSTGTHGTGAELGALSTFVEAMEIVTGDGSVLHCSRTENPDVFAAARVGLGALGLVSTITLRCVPAFTLRAVNEPMRLDDVLAVLDEHVSGNDHFEFNWFPHTEWVQAKQNNRVDQEPESRARAKEWFDEVFLENVALNAAWRVGRRFPASIPGISRQLTRAITRVESTEKSYKVFTTPRLVRFYEMEYGVPRAAVVDCVRELRAFIDASGLQIQVPVEVRFVAGDDIPLSMASGRDSAFVACHVFQGRGYEQYFRGVERIMAAAGGRPHWGKLHFQTAETLAPRYPQWDVFQKVRDQVDPQRVFTNPYLDRVLG
ncbi:MAG TPA: D-arabinono-1,4-lactone oxidase [Acidimicrobiales bacterium]|nr:D-arabinono-1,4-lactone oxidase [Acidimicrobiales bacterium]